VSDWLVKKFDRNAQVIKLKPTHGVKTEEWLAKHPEYEMLKGVDSPEPDEIGNMALGDESDCTAMDGCRTDPDNVCQHGFPSWPLAYGLI
jgi:hypothetical protein